MPYFFLVISFVFFFRRNLDEITIPARMSPYGVFLGEKGQPPRGCLDPLSLSERGGPRKKKERKKRRIMNLLLYIMLNLNRSNFQAHPFHLVSPSP